MPDAMLVTLRTLLPPGAGVGWADPRADHPLIAGEDLPRATPPRLAEFAAGRHAARMALRAIGLPDVAIPHGPDRAPVWPDGVIGSITHTATTCLAVAMHAGPLRGIGIDLEPAAPLDSALWETILLPHEQAALPQADRGLAALHVFCAKEAAFKAHYPLTSALVGFEVMAVHIEGDRFVGTFQTAIPPLAMRDRVQGRILLMDGHIFALAML